MTTIGKMQSTNASGSTFMAQKTPANGKQQVSRQNFMQEGLKRLGNGSAQGNDIPPEQQQLINLGIPAEVIAKGDDAIQKYAQEHNIKNLPPKTQKPEEGEQTAPEQQLLQLGIPADIIAQGREAVGKYAHDHEIPLP